MGVYKKADCGHVKGVGGSRETKVDMLSKEKTIPYGRTRGILFREKKKKKERAIYPTGFSNKSSAY